MLINDNNICNVKFRGEDAVALYFGATLVWLKNVSKVIISGNFVKNTTDADRWLYYNGEKHYIETNEFEIEVDSPITFQRVLYDDSTPFASDKIENLIVPYIDNLTNISRMFENCYKLQSLDLSAVDTSNVKEMYEAFYGCEKLETLNLGDFDMSKVSHTWSMFGHCYSLTSLDLSNINANNVTDMSSMFSNCTSLTSIKLTNFGTGGATSMRHMFNYCTSLTSLDLSTFNTLNVTDMDYMFSGCSSLETLNIDGWDFSKVKDSGLMFQDCTSLTTVIGEFEGISFYSRLDYCPLTRESALAFIKGLNRNVNNKILFKGTTYSSLSEEDIALATSKGWTVAANN